MKKKTGVDPKPMIERISEDTGLSDGLQDQEAELLLQWLRTCTNDLCARSASVADAEKRYAVLAERARKITRVTAAWCIDDDEVEARRHWPELGMQGSIESLPKDAAKAVAYLIRAEGGHNA